MPDPIDPRLRTAVDAQLAQYLTVCATHGVGSVLVDGLWRSVGQPPPL